MVVTLYNAIYHVCKVINFLQLFYMYLSVQKFHL